MVSGWGSRQAAVPAWGLGLQRRGRATINVPAHHSDGRAAGCQQDPRAMILGHQQAFSPLVRAQLGQCPRAGPQPWSHSSQRQGRFLGVWVGDVMWSGTPGNGSHSNFRPAFLHLTLKYHGWSQMPRVAPGMNLNLRVTKTWVCILIPSLKSCVKLGSQLPFCLTQHTSGMWLPPAHREHLTHVGPADCTYGGIPHPRRLPRAVWDWAGGVVSNSEPFQGTRDLILPFISPLQAALFLEFQ